MKKLKSLAVGLALFFGVEAPASACWSSLNSCDWMLCMVNPDNGFSVIMTDYELYALAILYYRDCWH